MNVSAQALRDNSECVNIYKGASPKKKTDLIEMIIYGCITEKLNKREIEDISIKQVNQILNKNNIVVKSLPRINAGLRKKKKLKHILKKNHLLRCDIISKLKILYLNFLFQVLRNKKISLPIDNYH